MRMPSKRAVVIASVVALAAVGAAGGALAASGTFDPAAEKQAYLNDVAGRLGVTSAKLETALKGAAIDRVDAALAAGRITKDQADAMKAAINAGKLPVGAGFGFMPGPGLRHVGVGLPGSLDAAATYLGLTEAQLRTQLESGKSLADVAKAQGKSVDGLKQALLDSIQSKLDQAVKAGKLTTAQSADIMARIKASIDDLINGKLPSKPFREFHRQFGERFGGPGFGFMPRLREGSGMFRGPTFRNGTPGSLLPAPTA
jgi:hypothetical protein